MAPRRRIELVAKKRKVRLLPGRAFEPQIGIGKRFGDMQAVEFWGAVAFRWTAFPWNNYVKTTIAISEGVSLATQVDTVERDANPITLGRYSLIIFPLKLLLRFLVMKNMS